MKKTIVFGAIILAMSNAFASEDHMPLENGNVTSSFDDSNVLHAGAPLTFEDLEEEAGNPLIVIIVVRGTIQVVKSTCSKSPKSCSEKALSLAKWSGGVIAGSFIGENAKNYFCSSKWAKYGAWTCK